MKNVTETTEVKTTTIPLVGYMLVEIDTTDVNMDDSAAVLEAAKKQLPHYFRNGSEWRIDECSEYSVTE